MYLASGRSSGDMTRDKYEGNVPAGRCLVFEINHVREER